MKKVLICGYFGFNNFGDELLLDQVIKDLLKVGFFRENISTISKTPNITSEIYNIKASARLNIFTLFWSIISVDILVFTGGLFQDKTSLKSFLYYFFIAFLGVLTNKKIVFYGSGIGPIKSKIALGLFNFLIDKIDYITVRDNSSAKYLPYSGITTIDPAWSFEADLNVQKKISGINFNKPVLGVALRYDKYLTQNHLKFFSSKFSKLLSEQEDWQILFIPCMFNEDWAVNFNLYEDLVRKVGSSRVHIIDDLENFTIAEQAGLFTMCDAMFAMRYHALLLALSYGKPVLGITCDPKIKSICDFASQVNFNLKDDLDHPWSYFWQNIAHSTQHAKEAKEKAIEYHKENVKLLERAITS